MHRGEAARRLKEVIRHIPLALAMKRTCCPWPRRYSDCLKGLPLHLPSQHKLDRFLTVLTTEDVAASTQNQDFNAVIPKPGVSTFWGAISEIWCLRRGAEDRGRGRPRSPKSEWSMCSARRRRRRANGTNYGMHRTAGAGAPTLPKFVCMVTVTSCRAGLKV